MKTKLWFVILAITLICSLYFGNRIVKYLSIHNGDIAIQGQIDMSNVGIFIYNPIFHSISRITPQDILAFSPAWSPNGDTIAFLLTDSKRKEFKLASIQLANGGITTFSNAVPIDGKIYQETSIAWSPDGEEILYNTISAEGCNLFYLYQIKTEEIIPTNISICNRKNNHQVKKINISWSPGETPIIGLNYLGFDSNLDEIYIINDVLTEAKFIVNGSNPLWIRNKKSFSFICWDDTSDMAKSFCEYENSNSIRKILQLSYGQNTLTWEPDGQSFLYIEEKGESDPLYLSRVTISSGEISHLYNFQPIYFRPFPVVGKWIEAMVITSSGK
jgi:hypothetical protein